MKPSGYSGKSLINKLGYRPGDLVFIVGAPAEFKKYLQSEEVMPTAKLPATWAHIFCRTTDDLLAFLRKPEVEIQSLEKGFWVSWPKKASGVKTDLTEQTFRDYILPTGWVDVKVAAINEIWSGLKFLRRKT